MSQIGAVAGNHRRQHRGVVLAQPQWRGQSSHCSGQRQQPRSRRLLRAAHFARQKRARCLAQRLHSINRNRRRGCNPLIQQIIGAAPYPWIAINLRPQQTNHRPHPLAALKRSNAGLRIALRAILRAFTRTHRPSHRQPHSAAHRCLRIVLVIHRFNSRDP